MIGDWQAIDQASGHSDPNWPNFEDNSDLDTSNDSYMSSDDESNDKELNREEKAIVSRRFQEYFNKVRVTSDEYWRNGQKNYNRSEWIKLTFDGQTKRCKVRPSSLEDLLNLAKKRFGVLPFILDTEQFKPIISIRQAK